MENDLKFDSIIENIAVIPIPLFMLGLLISLVLGIHYGDYSFLFNTISELGSIHFTPFPEAINVTFIITSLLLGIFYYVFFQKIYSNVGSSNYHKGLCRFGFTMFIISNISFFFVGIFSVDVSYLFHIGFAATVFISLLIGEIIFGYLVVKFQIFNKIIGLSMIFLHLFVCLLIPIFPAATSILEWCMFFVLIVWGVPVSIALKKL